MSKQKYRMLFSPNRRRKPGPKGPSVELVRAVVEMKQRNPSWGCPRIAQQMALAFHIPIDKDVVRRILARHYRPGQDSDGPSWLTFLGHMKDSLWSMDLFRCASATCGPTGSWWSWINLRAGSLGSASMRERSMVSHSVGCSTAPFEGNAGCRSTSAPTAIRLSVPPMASQSADTGGHRNQVHPLRSPVPSVCGKAVGTFVVHNKCRYVVFEPAQAIPNCSVI